MKFTLHANPISSPKILTIKKIISPYLIELFINSNEVVYIKRLSTHCILNSRVCYYLYRRWNLCIDLAIKIFTSKDLRGKGKKNKVFVQDVYSSPIRKGGRNLKITSMSSIDDYLSKLLTTQETIFNN